MICDGQPRLRFANLPTPLERAPRLSAALGVNLLIKREDLSGLCVGGNKTRLLEFALGALRADGIDTLIAYAREQSNKLRDIAAAAARCGLRAVLLFAPDRVGGGSPPEGNRLLCGILGATLREVEPGLDAAAELALQERVRAELAAEGRQAAILDRRVAYGMHATIAYVDAAEELQAQLRAEGGGVHSVHLAAGAGMTAAGLALGLKHLASPARVVAVSSGPTADDLWANIIGHAGRAAAELGIPTRLAAADLSVIDSYATAGHGVLTPRAADAIRLFARLHGMVVDPVYNANVVLALCDRVASGAIPRGATVVYVNTGGLPALFAGSALLAGPEPLRESAGADRRDVRRHPDPLPHAGEVRQ